MSVNDSAPIACTLSAAEMPRREAQIRALARDGLISVAREEQRAQFRFRAGSDLRRRIDELVDAESQCCAFLDFQVAQERDATVLTISAPHGGEPTLHGLAALFTPTG